MILDATSRLDSNTTCVFLLAVRLWAYLSELCFIFLFPFLFPLTGSHIAKDYLFYFFR